MKIKYIVIHCSATANGQYITFDAIEREHKRLGWGKIGYHYLILTDGIAVSGRKENEMGSHVKGHNTESIGVCMVGGVDKANGIGDGNPGRYSKAQWDALRSLIVDLKSRYPEAIVVGHRDLSPDLDGDGVIERQEWVKLCPSFDVAKWLSRGMLPEARNVL